VLAKGFHDGDRATLVSARGTLEALAVDPLVHLLLEVPLAVDNTYRQRYQAAQFLSTYYDGVPIATGELGYISLEHEGRIIDVLGLGSFEVLQARLDGEDGPEFWAELIEREGVRVAVLYPSTLGFDSPEDWIWVGAWDLGQRKVTAFESVIQIWATDPTEVAPLKQHLEEYESRLPAGVTTTFNELAELHAANLIEARGG
jgi:hypothetical protein